MPLPLFKEKSRLLNIGLFFLTTPAAALVIYLVFDFVNEPKIGLKIFDLAILFIILISMFLLYVMKLTLIMDKDAININYFPFKNISISKNDIKFAEILKIDSFKEFGGWGMRSNKALGKAYTTKGDTILSISTFSGKKICVTVIDVKSLEPILKEYLILQ